MDTPKIVWYLENVGVRYRISFVLVARYFWIDNEPDTWRWVEDGDDLNMVKHQKQPLNSYYRINLSAGAWELPVLFEADSIGTQRLHVQVPAALQNPEVFLVIIFNSCSCPFLFRFNFLSQIPFNIIDIRSGVKKETILWRTKRLLVLHRTKLLNLWWCNLLYKWITTHNTRKADGIYI